MKPTPRYDFNDYNNDGVLKVGAMNWLLLVYLSRHLLLFLLSGFSTYMMSRRGYANISFLDTTSSPLFLLASLPALVFFAAAMRRSPSAGRTVREIWVRGRWWLATAAAIDLALLCLSVYNRPYLASEWHIGFAVLDLFIIIYIVFSERFADLLDEFPAAPEKAKH